MHLENILNSSFFFTAFCISLIWSRMSTGWWQSRSLLHWQCWTFDLEWFHGQWSLCTHHYSRFRWIGSSSVPSRVFQSLGNCDCNHRWHWVYRCGRGTVFGRSHRWIGQHFLHANDCWLLGTYSKFNLKSIMEFELILFLCIVIGKIGLLRRQKNHRRQKATSTRTNVRKCNVIQWDLWFIFTNKFIFQRRLCYYVSEWLMQNSVVYKKRAYSF